MPALQEPPPLAGIGATAALLAGCTSEPPAPRPDAPVVAAVVSEPQERRILDSVAAVATDAGQDGGATSLDARLSGPALSTREAETRAAAATGDAEILTDLTLRTQQMILPSEQGWPRSSFAIMKQPPSGASPVLAAFDQANARDQYKLWAYVRLVTGVTMPQFADSELGSPAVAADDTSLLVAPGAVAQRYASVLTRGDRSEHAETFAADDYLRQRLRDSGREQVAEIEEKDGEGSFEVTYEPAEHPVRAVRTLDGGAMVLVALRSQETLRAEEGWQLEPASPSAAALWGDAEGTEVMRTAYHDTVALYVPPAGSAAKISLLGFHRVPSSVSGG